MSKATGGKISVWNLSRRAKVYPHLEWSKYYNQTEMRALVTKLKTELPDLNIVIHEKSSYCNELNGEWNVCFGVPKDVNGKPILYTYIIRSDTYFGKTYGCPFMNTDYIYSLNHTGLMKGTNEELFGIIENKIMELVPGAVKSTHFDT